MGRKLRWRLDDETLSEIIRLKSDGLNDYEVAAKVNVSRSTVRAVRVRLIEPDAAREKTEQDTRVQVVARAVAGLLGRVGPMPLGDIATATGISSTEIKLAIAQSTRRLWFKPMGERWRLTELGRRELLSVQRSA